MTSITQQIPNYIGGISQQPDELKVPGQVRAAKNVLPDVTHGLLKRPGGRLIGSALAAFNVGTNDSKWFHYYRDESEQYIGQIQLSDGDIKVWRCDTGALISPRFKPLDWATNKTYNVGDEVTSTNNRIYKNLTETNTVSSGSAPSHTSGTAVVGPHTWEHVTTTAARETALKNYLKTRLNNGVEDTSGGTHLPAHLQTLTLNDFTYITNRNKTAKMAATVEPERDPEAYIELKKVAYASQYSVNLFDTTALTTVTTATRIKVKRAVDSGSSCRGPTSGAAYASSGDGRGAYPPSGVEPGTVTAVGGVSYSWQGACDTKADYNDLNNTTRDSYCPNVETRIFKISHTTDNSITDQLADSNGTKNNYTVTRGNDAAGNPIGNAADRKELFLRITTTGQATPESESGDDGPKYVCRYTTTHDLLHGGSGWQVGDTVQVWMKGARYDITIEEVSTAKVQANLGLIRPTPTSFDTKTVVTAESILGDIQSGILTAKKSDGSNSSWVSASSDGSGNETVQIIGNGIYIKRPTNTFNISTPVGELLNVLTGSVKDVADLPKQCKHGYVVKVSNSDSDEDDYYVKFFGHNNRDGDGVWEECVKPGQKIELDSATMPIQLVRRATDTFVVEPVTWENRLVGDWDAASETGTVPEPSFIGQTINKMLFFRNRLVMLSDENVIMSRPGSFYDFWPKSAIAFTATDNIDISCSSEYPAIVYDGLQVNSGLILFTENQQFMLTTDSDVLSPLTAKINALSTYNFNSKSNPISLGTSIAFLDNAGKYSRFFEMTSVLREGEPVVIEQSKNISKLFDKNIDLVANSRENSTIFFGVKGTAKLYGFRYFQTGDRRIQQAWFEWELSGNLEHIAMLDDALYAIIKNNNTYTMQKFSIKLDDNSHTIVEDATYRVHLDNATVLSSSNLAYEPSGDYTKINHTNARFPLDSTNIDTTKLYAVAVATGSDKSFNGQLAKVTTFTDDGDGVVKVKLPGNWKQYEITRVKLHEDVATRAGNTVTIKYENHPFKQGDSLQLDFQHPSGSGTTPTDGNYTVATVATDGDSFTITDSASGTISTPVDVVIQSVQTPTNDIIIGYDFDMEVQFPTIYVGKREGEGFRSDIQGSLILQRTKFSFGPSGVYKVTLKRIGKPDYSEIYESIKADTYTASTVGIDGEQIVNIPIYEKNTNLTLLLNSQHPSPATLYSMNWEGSYSNRYYKRV